ncbi:1598_t:CDS:2 [Entrophospora sp. SA101]|nr:3763_t:CDS:2 [Entrophospora sp. SA101]CAJ0755585.1 1598_t:CDS:2 [Entrophospora sp. SA101]
MTGSRDLNAQIESLVNRLRRRQVIGSLSASLETALLLRHIVSTTRWKHINVLINVIKDVGRRLVMAQPKELVVGNIVRRVLRLIPGLNYAFTTASMINLLGDGIPIIMTIGKSRTVEVFLKTAAKKRKFSVIVAETSPTYLGHEMALSLSQAGIDTTVIADSAIFAVMSRVNKVIMGTHAVLANGGLISVSGSQMVATAAKHHSTPVVVCTGLYKLSPLYPYDEDSFNDLVAPDPILSFEEGDLIDKATFLNPYYDYVSPGLVSIFVTNTGGHPPSYLYRLINENYDPEDTII